MRLLPGKGALLHEDKRDDGDDLEICYWFGLPLYHHTLQNMRRRLVTQREKHLFVHGIPKEGFVWAFGVGFPYLILCKDLLH